MRRNILLMAAAIISLLATSCLKQDNLQTQKTFVEGIPETKSVLVKSPKLHVYVETNDVNPLNALDYKVGNKQLIDVVELFAANIHKKTVEGEIQPVLYLNDKLTPVLANNAWRTNVIPLTRSGIKVLLTILGDHQQIGLANMNETQQKQFVNELLYAYYSYGLSGFGFDDEYADYNWLHPANTTSYSGIIDKLKNKDSQVLTSVFYWGHANTLNASAKANVDYFYHGNFTAWNTNPAGVDKSKWAPACWNMGYSGNSTIDMETLAEDAKAGGYGSLMFFNLRCRNEQGIVDPLLCFQAIANGAYNGQTVTCSGGNRARVAPVSGGLDIDHETAYNYLVANNLPHFF